MQVRWKKLDKILNKVKYSKALKSIHQKLCSNRIICSKLARIARNKVNSIFIF